MESIKLLVVIGTRDLKDRLVESLAREHVSIVARVYGKSWLNTSDLGALFGLTNNPGKIVIFGLTRTDNLDKVYGILNDKFGFNRKNTGIAFAIPVDQIHA
jgi:hypothetical protein